MSWPDVRLVAGREVYERLRSRAFVLSTLFLLVLVVVSVALPALLDGDDVERYDVAVVGAPAGALVDAVPLGPVDARPRPVADAAEADRLVQDEAVDVALEVTPQGLRLTARQDVPDDLAQALAGTAQAVDLQRALTGAGTLPEQVQRLLAPVPVQERLLADRGVDPDVIAVLTVAFGLLFFLLVFQYGFALAQGVVQEKESRIVELLVTAVPVRTLLAGKVLGTGVLALGQVVLIAVVALAGAALSGDGELVALLAPSSAWFVVFFALGFTMLSCLWAAAGAFAGRTEDLQGTTVPLQLLVMVPFFASVYVTGGLARTVLSYVPLTSPLVMPGRLVSGDAAAWEAPVAALLLLATAVLAVLAGERLYRASLLRTRGRTSLADAWRGRVEKVS